MHQLLLLQQSAKRIAAPLQPLCLRRGICEAKLTEPEPVQHSQVGLAADWLRRDIIGVAESGGLQAQAYWLSTTLALGAFLKARCTS